jgi:hypothetical protein
MEVIMDFMNIVIVAGFAVAGYFLVKYFKKGM